MPEWADRFEQIASFAVTLELSSDARSGHASRHVGCLSPAVMITCLVAPEGEAR